MLDSAMPVLRHLDFVKQDMCREFKCHIFRVIYLGASWTMAVPSDILLGSFPKSTIFWGVLKSTEFHSLSVCTDVKHVAITHGASH